MRLRARVHLCKSTCVCLYTCTRMRVCTQHASVHAHIGRGGGACAAGTSVPGSPRSLLQAPSCLNNSPSVGSPWTARSGPFGAILQVQCAPTPALMGCSLRPWTVTLSQPSIYGTGQTFSLNKSNRGDVGRGPGRSGAQPGWPGARAAHHELQGSPQPRLTTFSPGPQAFGGLGREWAGKDPRPPGPHSDGIAAKGKLGALGSSGPQGSPPVPLRREPLSWPAQCGGCRNPCSVQSRLRPKLPGRCSVVTEGRKEGSSPRGISALQLVRPAVCHDVEPLL